MIDLKPREIEILQRLVNTHNNKKQVASDMALSMHTLKAHLGSIYRVLGVGNVTGAIIEAVKLGVVEIRKDKNDDDQI